MARGQNADKILPARRKILCTREERKCDDDDVARVNCIILDIIHYIYLLYITHSHFRYVAQSDSKDRFN